MVRDYKDSCMCNLSPFFSFRRNEAMQKIRTADVINLPFGTNIILELNNGRKYKAVVFGNKIGFENGDYMEITDIGQDKSVYLGWQ